MVVGEEVEPGTDDQFDLGPAAFGDIDRLGEPLEPIAEQPLEHLVVQGLFGRKVVEQTRTANSDPCGDVVERGAVVAMLC